MRTFTIPSVYEENYQLFRQITDDPLEGLRLTNFQGKDYIIGDLAINEGISPHKLLNSSADDLDYRLLATIGLLVASRGTFDSMVVTTGFPFSSYLPFKDGAEGFLKGNHKIEFDTRTLGGKELNKLKIDVKEAFVLSEIEGVIKYIRSDAIQEKDNMFVLSLGYGTLDLAFAKMTGIIHRTAQSVKGVSYAINLLREELEQRYYLDLLTDKDLEKAFQRGYMVINRKRVDLTEMRKRVIETYYNDVISPAIRKKFNDKDFLSCQKLYLAGGGAMLSDLVNLFEQEFGEILEVKSLKDAHLAASKGYYLHSAEKGKSSEIGMYTHSGLAYVGLDLGNSNLVVTVDEDADNSQSVES